MAYIIEKYNLRNYMYLVDTIGKKCLHARAKLTISFLKKMHNCNLF